MAHSALHFSLGMFLGTLYTAPRLFKAWMSSGKLTRPIARWLLLSLALGMLAILPGLLRRAGVPGSVCDGWWMNVCILYPVMNTIKPGGLILGLAGILLMFALQYTIILSAIIRSRHHGHTQDPEDTP